MFDFIEAVQAFTPGGCTDVVAVPDNRLVQLEKLLIQRYYRDAVEANRDKWRKAPGKGGHTEAYRRRICSNLISRARKQFLNENFGAIWKRYVEVGFIVRCDGSEENKIALRDGN